MSDSQLLIYEIKGSADKNSDALFHSNGKYFYWNEDKFSNLGISDNVIVVNTHSRYVLFTSLDKRSIEVKYDQSKKETSFTDESEVFKVSGEWNKFIRLKINKKFEIPEKWKWKSLGSSETTYLLGERVNLDAAENRIININQLREISKDREFNEQLEKAYTVFDISNFAGVLKKFLEQSKSANLKTSHYPKNYKNTKVKVSFGQGTPAQIPWISFLGSNQTTSKGIYPAYLHYKKEGILILAYGISETNKPSIAWNLKESRKIKDYFNEIGKEPEHYGESYIYKKYEIANLPPDESLNGDLNELIEYYRTKLEGIDNSGDKIPSVKFSIENLKQASKNAGLIFSLQLLARFTASLCTKPFVILTGLSGSGKTKLAQAFVQWICQDTSQYVIVPVGADWTNREPLLGFLNALDQTEYIEPDSGVLTLIQKAGQNKNLPYFLILDEMNLSHVERYFADFLSVMESNDSIKLHNSEKCKNPPKRINLPDNLYIIGTVNIDETTYMFSPKVLDRANTIEFRINEMELKEFLDSNKELKMDELMGKGAKMAIDFVDISRKPERLSSDEINKKLVSFFGELKKAGSEFGYRTANEIHTLLGQLGRIDSTLKENEKLDIAVMQKLLPKLHGSRRKLEKILLTLCSLCLKDGIKDEEIEKYFNSELEVDLKDPNILFPISLEKIQRMYQGAIDHGFASYAEA